MARMCKTVGLFAHSTVKYLRNSVSLTTSTKRHGSALYVPGNKARETFAVLMPYIDYDVRFSKIDNLVEELSMRGMKIDAKELKATWEFYRYVERNKSLLEDRRLEIAARMKVLQKKTEITAEDEQEMIMLKINGKIARQDLKIVKDTLWELEETVVVRALKLPNKLHPDTPSSSPIVLSTVGNIQQPTADKLKSHVEIGKALGLLDYRSPSLCYLCNDAVLFELGALGLAGNIFSDNNMIRVAGSDFSRSIVVEGSGLNHEDPYETFTLEDNEEIERNSSNRLHLVGGASLVSFLAMHTKQLINPKHFPLKYFATGRQYTPLQKDSDSIGLFATSQASVAHVFVVVQDAESSEHEQQFDKLVHSVARLYDKVCSHYRIVKRPAVDLRPWESLRVSFELWSAFSKQYVEVGHISVCGEFFSKRLLIGYQTPTGRGFPAIISGTVLSVPRLLGCLLEECPDKFVIPKSIEEHMPARFDPLKTKS